MLDKTKWAPQPPPEPVITGSLAPEPKKRGRKRTKKQYFTSDTDAAIKEYLATSNQSERDHIFRTRIHYPFYKLAENLIHTFKFYYTEVDDLEDLKHEVICFLLEKLDYFKPEKGTKAFSYFSIVGKNYLILYNNNNYKKKKDRAEILAVDDDPITQYTHDREEIKKEYKDFIDLFVEYWEKHLFTTFKKPADRRVADAVILLFKRRENLEIFNKKALYIYIREMTNVETPVITKVTKVLKKHYKKLWGEYAEKGTIRI